MSTQRIASLRRAYLSVGTGELAAAAMFVALAAWWSDSSVADPQSAAAAEREVEFALWSALVPLVVILIQAGIYWLAARTWIGHGPMPASTARVYRAFRFLDPVILATGLVGVIAWFPGGSVALLLLGVWLFGVVEYLNYFVVRLSYPMLQWSAQVTRWSTPRMVRDMRSATPRRVPPPG